MRCALNARIKPMDSLSPARRQQLCALLIWVHAIYGMSDDAETYSHVHHSHLPAICSPRPTTATAVAKVSLDSSIECRHVSNSIWKNLCDQHRRVRLLLLQDTHDIVQRGNNICRRPACGHIIGAQMQQNDIELQSWAIITAVYMPLPFPCQPLCEHSTMDLIGMTLEDVDGTPSPKPEES